MAISRRATYRTLLTLGCALTVAAVLLRFAPWGVPKPWLFGLAIGGGVLTLLSVWVWRMPDACDEAPLAVRQRYVREFFPTMLAYLVAVFASGFLLKRIDEPLLRGLVALLPVPPIFLAMRSIVRYIRAVDEMQQRIELEAISAATAFVTLLYLAGGFLQSAKVIDLRASTVLLMAFPLVCGAYGFAKLLVTRRYR